MFVSLYQSEIVKKRFDINTYDVLWWTRAYKTVRDRKHFSYFYNLASTWKRYQNTCITWNHKQKNDFSSAWVYNGNRMYISLAHCSAANEMVPMVMVIVVWSGGLMEFVGLIAVCDERMDERVSCVLLPHTTHAQIGVRLSYRINNRTIETQTSFKCTQRHVPRNAVTNFQRFFLKKLGKISRNVHLEEK